MREPNWKLALERLHLLTVYIRWLVVVLCWLTLGSYGLWQLREEYPLLQEYFTWTAVRYALIFNPVAAFCLLFCLGITGAALIYTSFYLFFSPSKSEQEQLLKQAKKIYSKGTNHPFYAWVYRSKK